MTILLSNERGFLNADGELQCKGLREQLKAILAMPEDEIHLRTLGCCLKAMVGDELSAALMKVRNK